MGRTQWRKLGAEFGGGRKNFSQTKMTFSEKIPIFAAKISDDLFLVIDQVFRIFPLFSLIFRIFTLLHVIENSFLTRKTPFFPFWWQQFFSLVIRQHYFSKYWGTNAWAVPHLKLWGAVPQPP